MSQSESLEERINKQSEKIDQLLSENKVSEAVLAIHSLLQELPQESKATFCAEISRMLIDLDHHQEGLMYAKQGAEFCTNDDEHKRIANIASQLSNYIGFKEISYWAYPIVEAIDKKDAIDLFTYNVMAAKFLLSLGKIEEATSLVESLELNMFLNFLDEAKELFMQLVGKSQEGSMTEEEAALFQHLLEIIEGSWIDCLEYGKVCYLLGFYGESEEALDCAITFSAEEQAEAFFQKGELFLIKAQKEERAEKEDLLKAAQSCFVLAIEKDPAHKGAMNRLK